MKIVCRSCPYKGRKPLGGDDFSEHKYICRIKLFAVNPASQDPHPKCPLSKFELREEYQSPYTRANVPANKDAAIKQDRIQLVYIMLIIEKRTPDYISGSKTGELGRPTRRAWDIDSIMKDPFFLYLVSIKWLPICFYMAPVFSRGDNSLSIDNDINLREVVNKLDDNDQGEKDGK